MTNYMGKRRLRSILLQMLSDRPELQAQFKDEHSFMKYKFYNGSEWLEVQLGRYRFEIYATGATCKAVSFEEYRTDEYGDIISQHNRIVTKYNENFEPFPLATWFSGGCELRKQGYYPFQIPEPDDPFFNFDEAANLNPDSFVCRNIAKKQQNVLQGG